MSSPIRRRSTALLRGRRPPDSARSAYVTGPPSDPIVTDSVPKVDVSSSDGESRQSPPKVITWGLLWSLLLRHKLRIAVSMATLVGCSACTLAMPLYSGKFFEVLIGTTPKPLWNVLSKVAVLYALEPILTVIFVVNLNTIWEKVMSNLRAQIFQRVLIQKVEFFDRYKVGEITALLTSDLGSLKDIVSENISRDRGFRALSEASHSTLSESQLYIGHSHWNHMHPVHFIPRTRAASWATYAHSVCFSCCL